ncbi:MAG TPA: hypothetical protein VHW23_05535 [Kofleriaceae bacterium]|jgi:hypothetical protein|nr:hypothetical protein [Kofleriaceae bacterium]
MPVPVHPRLHTRGGAERASCDGTLIRVLVYAPATTRASWVESELQDKTVMTQIGFSVAHVVSALVEDPPPRPQILVADFDAISPAEIMHLHVLREQGWFGRIIALGGVPPALRSSLAIEHVLGPPYVRDALRDVITHAGLVVETTKLPVL